MPKRAAALMAYMAMKQGKAAKLAHPRVDAATAWRRRTLRLVDLCMMQDAEHVCSKGLRRWPIAAVLEATEGWRPDMFALVVREWKIKKVARLLEAKGRDFTVRCCAEWEPEYLQVILPQIDLVTARHVLAELYFKSDDKHLSAYECRMILEQYGQKAQRKLIRKFTERDVARVMGASPTDESSDDDSEEDEDEDNSMDGFIVDGEEDEDDDDDDDDEGAMAVDGDDEEEDGDDDDDDDDESEGDALKLIDGATPMKTDEESGSEDDDEEGGSDASDASEDEETSDGDEDE